MSQPVLFLHNRYQNGPVGILILEDCVLLSCDTVGGYGYSSWTFRRTVIQLSSSIKSSVKKSWASRRRGMDPRPHRCGKLEHRTSLRASEETCKILKKSIKNSYKTSDNNEFCQAIFFKSPRALLSIPSFSESSYKTMSF
jgi:hypothetical protein